VRNWGSRNAGATNVFRNYNIQTGTIVLILDILKGMLAIIMAQAAIAYFKLPYSMHIKHLCFLAVVLGHCLPVFFCFKGGKAVATAMGCLLMLHPLLISIALAVFVLVFIKIRIVGVSSVCAALSLLPSYFVVALINNSINWDFLYILAVVLIIVITHIKNLKLYLS
ncbi:MAG: glycerol-3-phosphate acyltransferase, partial [Oscillospiraceae bacterium]